MTIQERAARAVELKAGCNCAQAVALAFADLLPLDEQTLMKLAAGYGAGMRWPLPISFRFRRKRSKSSPRATAEVWAVWRRPAARWSAR